MTAQMRELVLKAAQRQVTEFMAGSWKSKCDLYNREYNPQLDKTMHIEKSNWMPTSRVGPSPLGRLATGLLLLGVVGWFAAPAYMLGLLPIPATVEVPQGELETIAVDPEGRIYCGGQFWQRVQVYDHDGNFLHGWLMDASG